MGRGRLLKTKVREAFAIEEAKVLGKASGEAKAHKKKKLDFSLKEHLGRLVDRLDPTDTIIFAGLLTYYGYVLKHDLWFAAMESGVDLGLIHSQTEAGAVAVVGHVGVAALPNLANALDKLTGGPGNVWQDFLEALRRQGLIPGDQPIAGSSGTVTPPPPTTPQGQVGNGSQLLYYFIESYREFVIEGIGPSFETIGNYRALHTSGATFYGYPLEVLKNQVDAWWITQGASGIP